MISIILIIYLVEMEDSQSNANTAQFDGKQVRLAKLLIIMNRGDTVAEADTAEEARITLTEEVIRITLIKMQITLMTTPRE